MLLHYPCCFFVMIALVFCFPLYSFFLCKRVSCRRISFLAVPFSRFFSNRDRDWLNHRKRNLILGFSSSSPFFIRPYRTETLVLVFYCPSGTISFPPCRPVLFFVAGKTLDENPPISRFTGPATNVLCIFFFFSGDSNPTFFRPPSPLL